MKHTFPNEFSYELIGAVMKVHRERAALQT